MAYRRKFTPFKGIQLKETRGKSIMKVLLKYDFCIKEVMENEIVRKHFISDGLGIPLEDI